MFVDFLRWTLSYAPDDSFGFRPLINLGFTLRGHWPSLFGGRLNAISGLINPCDCRAHDYWVSLFLLLAFQVIRNFKWPRWKWLRQLQTRSMAAKAGNIVSGMDFSCIWSVLFLCRAPHVLQTVLFAGSDHSAGLDSGFA